MHVRCLLLLTYCPFLPRDGFQIQVQKLKRMAVMQSLSDSNMKDDNPRRLLVFGYGNIAKALFSELKGKNVFDQIYCTTRKSNDVLNEFPDIQYISFENARTILQGCSHVLITIPPVACNDSYSDIILDDSNILKSFGHDTKVCYVSTTGVYGNHDGEWVDESSHTLCKPESKAAYYLSFEKRYQSYVNPKNMIIFRCSGLYGNDSSALHTVMKRGGIHWLDICSVHDDITSRIHLNDAARSILASMNSDSYGIFNLADDEPASRREVMQYAYNLLIDRNIPICKKVGDNESNLSERMRRRVSDQKRVKNTKMKELLADNGGLNFPTYKEGLQSVLDFNLDAWKASI